MIYLKKFNESKYDEWFKIVQPAEIIKFLETHIPIELEQSEIDTIDNILNKYKEHDDGHNGGPAFYGLIKDPINCRSGMCWFLEREENEYWYQSFPQSGKFEFNIMVNKFPDEWYIVQYWKTGMHISVTWFIVDGMDGLKILLDKLKFGPNNILKMELD